MKNKNRFLFYILAAIILGCGQDTKTSKEKTVINKTAIKKELFGYVDNKPVTQYTLSNANGIEVSFLDYGGIITRIITPDHQGTPGDIVLGYDSLSGYLQKKNPYFGALIGRFANRITASKFSLDGKEYHLAANNHGNSLHGGNRGFDKDLWTSEIIPGDSSVRLTYISRDGEEGYPGNLNVEVIYTVSSDNSLRIEYKASADKATPVNLTNHSYFNLTAGHDSTVRGHTLMIKADQYVPIDSLLVPTGQLAMVKGTPMDFNVQKIIGKELGEVEGGYDHNWVLSRKGDGLEFIAELCDPYSGRCMEVWTTQPGLQFYSGNFLDGTLTGTKKGQQYVKHAGLSLETQHFPDSPNQPSFPNTILRPGETFNQTTVYKFKVK